MQEFITFLTNHPNLTMILIALLFLLTLIEVLRMKRNVVNISASEVTQLINRQNALIIDTRSQDDYKNGHIIDALHMPEINAQTKKLEKFKKRPLVIVCNNGVQAQKTAALLLKQGYNAFSLAGGMRSWLQAALPLIKE